MIPGVVKVLPLLTYGLDPVTMCGYVLLIDR